MTAYAGWLVDHAAVIAGGVALWLAVAIPVAVLIGHVIRHRDADRRPPPPDNPPRGRHLP